MSDQNIYTFLTTEKESKPTLKNKKVDQPHSNLYTYKNGTYYKVHRGSKKGLYYLNENGNKTYVYKHELCRLPQQTYNNFNNNDNQWGVFIIIIIGTILVGLGIIALGGVLG